MCRQSATVCLTKSPSRRQRELPDMNVRLSALPDPRDRRGRRHALASVLLAAACAVLAGARSYAAIGQWARHAPQDTLARLGFHPRSPLGVRRPASLSTVRRVLVAVCPGGLADLLGHSPARRRVNVLWACSFPVILDTVSLCREGLILVAQAGLVGCEVAPVAPPATPTRQMIMPPSDTPVMFFAVLQRDRWPPGPV
ncbi:transposase family protein [Streptomyces sp. IBSNAI002]|uniref:transposase family protein n=1 Tax=Streptomyces sp. IBSNAI002 TaxID=3457500 RepID=UPI003FD4BF7E